MRTEDFTGTGKLVRLIFRRDWLLLLAWAAVISLIALFVVVGFAKLYPTPETLKAFADTTNQSTSEMALLGKVLAPTLGGITAWRLIMPAFIIGGLASVLAVIKYTRTEEETGRYELVCSAAVGKHAALSAALIVAYVMNVAIAIVMTIIFIGLGLPAAGSAALALAIAAAGCVLAGSAAIAAQVAENTGMARGIAGAMLGLTFLVRVIADGADIPWLTWLSLAGWVQQVQAFAGERWWVFLPFVVSAAALAVAAFALSSRRDMGTGMLPQRPGPARASKWLGSPLALAWRLQRGMLYTWLSLAAFIGIVFGFLINTVSAQLMANPQFMEYLARLGNNAAPADSFFTMILMIMGEIVAVYAIMAALKLQAEENELHAEVVLATPVSRLSWAGSHLAIAILGTASILLVLVLAAGLTYGLSIGPAFNEVPRMTVAALAYLPAIWVLAGIAVALYGLLPRLTMISWGAFVVCLLIELLGEFGLASGLVLDISPFTHVPRLLVSDASVLPVIGLAVVAAVLVAVGLAGFRRRSIG